MFEGKSGVECLKCEKLLSPEENTSESPEVRSVCLFSSLNESPG